MIQSLSECEGLQEKLEFFVQLTAHLSDVVFKDGK